jgi:hypothetical protein
VSVWCNGVPCRNEEDYVGKCAVVVGEWGCLRTRMWFRLRKVTLLVQAHKRGIVLSMAICCICVSGCIVEGDRYCNSCFIVVYRKSDPLYDLWKERISFPLYVSSRNKVTFVVEPVALLPISSRLRPTSLFIVVDLPWLLRPTMRTTACLACLRAARPDSSYAL